MADQEEKILEAVADPDLIQEVMETPRSP